MKIRHQEIGICGLSCRLCPMYHTKSESRCLGCKSEERIQVGCPFITCAVKNKHIEFCWECNDNKTCEKWRKHRNFGNKYDTFICYQKLENNIQFIQHYGLSRFKERQNKREKLLKEMLSGFNEGRSKSYYCIVATVFSIDELNKTINEAKISTKDVKDIKLRSEIMHSILEKVADEKEYLLKIRRCK